ncbi:MAG TPA: DUF4367 domain-containing protein [Clostridia bacterium]|nr:DUF4367 domain-containing protein [Clostridia bacterium]
MKKTELNDRLFNTVLKAAVDENFWRELDDMPEEKELRPEYLPSPALKQKIRQAVKKGNRRAVLQKIRKAAKRAAVIAVILISVVMGSLLSVEASRNAIFNSVLEWKADHVDIYFRQEEKPQPEGTGIYKPQYIPEGFVELKSEKVGLSYETTYQNEKEISIIFDQSPLSSGKTMMDTEHSKYQKITISGQKAYLLEAKTPGDKTQIIWQVDKVSLKLSSKIDKKELILMAESVKYQQR